MNGKLNDAVLILNPTSSPAYLHEKFNKAGWLTIACFTSRDIDFLIKPIVDNEIFDDILFLSKNFEEDVALIYQTLHEKNLSIVLAFSSCEYDLGYSDKIVHQFCPAYANNPKTSKWRNNKRFMNTQLCENGTPATKQILINNIEDINWDDLQFPLVIKPTEGGLASIGVSICNSAEELQHYFDTLNQKKWGYFFPDSFLLEELLIGDEYIIDMVAWNSKFYLVGIYFAEKEIYGEHKICRHREFLQHDHPIAKQLYDYCSIVLKNLDVQYGMMHLECIITKDGPRLIELNPRVSGVSGMLNYFSEAMIGHDQANLLIWLMNNQGDVIHNEILANNKHGVVFYLQNFGFQYNKINEHLFKQVRSYQKHLVKIPYQLKASHPSNLLDTVAFVILVHDSREQVEKDLRWLKQSEAAGDFFEQI